MTLLPTPVAFADDLPPGGRWVTVNGQRIHINAADEIDAGGHPALRAALARGGLEVQRPDGCRSDTTFPATPADTKYLKTLGGSTGARLVKDTAGQKFVLKRGASPEHVREEEACNAMYRAAGLTVQDSRMYETPEGPVKLARYLDDVTPLGRFASDPAAHARAIAAVRQGFAADALFGNWDVIGMEYDNVMLTPAGDPVRIDNGGALRFRAQGGLKNDKSPGAWGPVATDVDTMRGIGKGSRTAASVFGGLTDADVAEQVKGLLGKRDAILAAAPDHLRDTIAARLTWMADRFKVTGAAPKAPKATQAVRGGTAYHARDLHAEGVWPVPDSPDAQPVKKSYGGVVFDSSGRVLLREPANHFGGYTWTFAKGGGRAGEAPADVAAREVAEETGHAATIVGHVPGVHASHPGSASYFYLMHAEPDPTATTDPETASLRWVTPAEARTLISQSRNPGGRARDLKLLDAAVRARDAVPSSARTGFARDPGYWTEPVVFDGRVTSRLALSESLARTSGMTEPVARAVLDAARPAG